jgi:hypothetical protein
MSTYPHNMGVCGETVLEWELGPAGRPRHARVSEVVISSISEFDIPDSTQPSTTAKSYQMAAPESKAMMQPWFEYAASSQLEQLAAAVDKDGLKKVCVECMCGVQDTQYLTNA